MNFVRIVVVVFLMSCGCFGQSARDIARVAFKSVVLLEMNDSNGQPLSLGSGFFIANGIIATNAHVIEGASSGTAKLVGDNHKLQILGTVAVDRRADLALLKVTSSAPSLVLGPLTSPTVGDNVYVVGNPLGLEGTFSEGIISGVRHVDAESILQMTAPISPGSSGGPVMNSSGAVIGIAVATFRDGQNLNLAVPVSYLSRLLALPPKPFISLGGHKANGETAKSMLDGVGAKPPVQNPPVSVEPLPPTVEEPKPPVLSPEIAEIERKAQAFHDQKRYSEAVPLFDKACSGGSGEACDSLGSAYDEGKYVAKDYSHAVALYSKACDAGSADGCSNLGSMYLNGRGVAKDDTKAVPLYSKACDAGSAKGCNGLGIMYETGRGVGLNQSRADCYHGGLDLCRYTTDYPHAVALYSKACDGGSADGCSNLGDMYLNGNGVAEDSSQALMLYSRACDAGSASGCSSIGLVYKKGYGVQKDKGRARQFFSKGCDMGNQWGCDQLKKM